MSTGELLTMDPVALAETAAWGSVRTATAETGRTVNPYDRVGLLDTAASGLGLLNKRYWLNASQGISLPKHMGLAGMTTTGTGIDVSTVSASRIEGLFIGYSRVEVGELTLDEAVHPIKVNGLCLAFTGALVVDKLSRLPDDNLLHVPVLAVNEIEPTPSFLL